MKSDPFHALISHYRKETSRVQNLVTYANYSYLWVTEVNDHNVYHLTSETF